MADFTFITGPRQAHGARTAAEYEALQRDHILRLHNSGRSPAPPEPFDAAVGAEPYISGGRWMLRCQCQSGASVSTEWHIARCFECGAVYRALSFPADRLAIEALLVRRARTARNWRPPTTLADLVMEDAEHLAKLQLQEGKG